MKKIITLLLACTFSILVLSGCGKLSDSNNKSVNENNDKTISSDENKSHYPVTINTYNYMGEEITTTYEKAPEKVIPVYQGSIETMIALGLEDKVVASYGLDNPIRDEWQEAFSKMNYKKEPFAPTKEEVVMLQTDMILSWGSIFSDKKLGDVNYWIEKNVNTYINTNTRSGGHSRTLENEYTDIINLGKIFNVEDKAEKLVNEMKKEISNVLEKVNKTDTDSVMVVEFHKDSITNYSKTTLAGDMVSKLGANLSLPDEKTISKETLVEKNPNVIFVVYMAYSGDNPETVKKEALDKILKDPSLASLDAVKNNRVYPLMLGDIYASGVRTLDGIRTISQGIYPEN